MDDFLTSSYIPENREESYSLDSYFKTSISFSHLLGSLSGIMTDYITSAFPKNFFAGIFNSQEEPYVQRGAAFRDFMTKPRPLMLVEQKFDPSAETDWVPISEFDNYIATDPNADIRYGLRDAIPIIKAPNFNLWYRPRRFRMTFNMSFVFDSDIQRIQAQQFLRQSIRHKSAIPMRKVIENFIPIDYMNAISHLTGYPIGSPELLDYLNKRSIYPINYRFRTGSGRYEYYVSITSPIQVLFTEGPSSDGPVKKGNITVQSSFSESIELDFTAPSIYFIKTPNDKYVNELLSHSLSAELEVTDKITSVAVDNAFVIQVPIGAETIGDFTKYITTSIQADKNGDDSINIRDLITDSDILNMIDYMEKSNQRNDIIRVIVYEGLDMIDPSRVTYNTKTLELTIKNMTIYKQYYIVIYINRVKMNKIIDSIFTTEPYDY